MKVDERMKRKLDIGQRQINAIEQRIESMISHYGFAAFRYVANAVIRNHMTKAGLEREIAKKESELADLKRKMR